MSSNSISSRRAARRSHSLMGRWSSGNGMRRRSGRGGKSGPGPAAPLASLSLPPLQPHQKTIAQHDGDGVAMKAIPAPSLILVPAQLGFGFLMILLDPVAAVSILDHRGPRRRRREITPEILPVPMLAASGALPNQPAHMAATIAIHPPAAQCHKLGPPPALGPCAPRDGLPIPARLRRQHRIGPLHQTGWPAPQGHTKTGPHRHHMALTALFQPIEEMGIIAVISVAGHTGVPHPAGLGFIQQRQGKLGFGLKPDRLRDMRLLTPRLIGRPLRWQVQPGGHRPGQRALGVMTIGATFSRAGYVARPRRGSPETASKRLLCDKNSLNFLHKSRRFLRESCLN
jgi:hypothetical protein